MFACVNNIDVLMKEENNIEWCAHFQIQYFVQHELEFDNNNNQKISACIFLKYLLCQYLLRCNQHIAYISSVFPIDFVFGPTRPFEIN